MGLETAAAVAGGAQLVGAGVNAWNQQRANAEMRRRQDMISRLIGPYMGSGPGQAENMLGEFLQDFGGTPQPGEGFNTGQDALLQMLRSDPNERVNNILGSIAETGNPYDTSSVFKTLQQVDARQRKEALGDLRAGASGLGQRFGTSMMRGEEDLVAKLLEQSEARNAQISLGAHESAQGRRLQATGQLSANNQAESQSDQAVAQLLTNLGLRREELGQTRAQMFTNALSQLFGMQQGRQQGDLSAISLLLGQPAGNQIYNPGQDLSQIGQLLMFMNMIRQGNTGANVTG